MIRITWSEKNDGQRVGVVGTDIVAIITPIPGDTYFYVTAGEPGRFLATVPGRYPLRDAVRKATSIVCKGERHEAQGF